MNAQSAHSEKENRQQSLEKKMANDQKTMEDIQSKQENDQNGYGNRDYKNDVSQNQAQSQSQGINNYQNSGSSNQQMASNNQNNSQMDASAQAQNQTAGYNNNSRSSYDNKQQGLGEDGKSFGGSQFSGNRDEYSSNDRNYENHETINAQYQQTQEGSQSRGSQNNNFDSQFSNQRQGMNSNDVTISGSNNSTQSTAQQTQGNTSGYDQGYNSNEGLRNLQEQSQSSPQMRYGGSEYGAQNNNTAYQGNNDAGSFAQSGQPAMAGAHDSYAEVEEEE